MPPPLRIYTLAELRSAAANSNPKLMAMLYQAADEIERLREQVAQTQKSPDQG